MCVRAREVKVTSWYLGSPARFLGLDSSPRIGIQSSEVDQWALLAAEGCASYPGGGMLKTLLKPFSLQSVSSHTCAGKSP